MRSNVNLCVYILRVFLNMSVSIWFILLKLFFNMLQLPYGFTPRNIDMISLGWKSRPNRMAKLW